MRTKTHVGGHLSGPDAESALHGDDTAVVARAAEFAAAGVDELVVEPQTGTLDGFLEQLTQLADLIVDVK